MAPIASAVVLPDPVPAEPALSPTAKRRLSSEPIEPSKRVRTSSEEAKNEIAAPLETSPESATQNKPSTDKPVEPRTDRRKASVQEERKRGQRLFGGLLSTLSQTAPNTQTKRRLEIEKRQQEKAKQQKAEDEKRRARKREDLVVTRKSEQIKFQESAVRTRHNNILAMAHSLYTKSEPRIPWELLPSDEERIKSQITEAEAQVRQEEDEFANRYPQYPRKKSSVADKTNTESIETVGEPQIESPHAMKSV
ncbi:hypothetical protein M7I_7149 [Glarea lozoyensis 74030]|uniref:Pinin/SDK/MemA protein domain-containing protein n=1 Tax=Glarea lozoyensis (strain ATCC 74030 / MF5533) TaxID=1104152 RepID=H0EWI3_GLAL7|nr:hypothetical protein M7I_7149 [Glarea lozoyensis 74030]